MNSYSNWFPGLFTSDGESRAFTDTGTLRTPDYQHDLARDFIASNFQTMGYTTWLDPFTYTRSGGYIYTNCNNVVAVKPGYGGTNIYILGAHYDSVDPSIANVTICPGADDNGSGVAGMLETASAIQDFIFRDTIIFIAFDSEEMGYRGSIHFVEAHTTNDPLATNSTTFYRPAIQGMISADMLAYADAENPNRVRICSVDGNINTPLHQALDQAVTRYTLLEPIHYAQLSGSDHQSFHQVGIDAVLYIEDDFFINPNYHDNADSIDTPNYISYAYGAENSKTFVGYLCEQARVIPPATLAASVPNNTTFTLSWETTPGVSYTLYGTEDLMTTNEWSVVGLYESAATSTVLTVQLNIETNIHRIFKVESR